MFDAHSPVNAHKLRAIPNNKADYVDLLNETKNISKEVKRLIKVIHFFPGCDSCDGRPYDATNKKGYTGKGVIEAGIQTKEIMEYELYDFMYD